MCWISIDLKIRHYSGLQGNLYILYLKTTDEAVELKKRNQVHRMVGGVIVFFIPIWQGIMSSITVFIDIEGLTIEWLVHGMPTTPIKE